MNRELKVWSNELDRLHEIERTAARQREALVQANNALRFLYSADLGEAFDMIVQAAFTATSVALSDNSP